MTIFKFISGFAIFGALSFWLWISVGGDDEIKLAEQRGQLLPWYQTQKPPPSLNIQPAAKSLILPEEQSAPAVEAPKPYEEVPPEPVYEAPQPEPEMPEIIAKVVEPTDAPALKPPLIPQWQRHAVAMAPLQPGPIIAIVIDDAGVDQRRTAQIFQLPAPLTISFLSYARNLKKQVQKARNAGHEIMLHMAMEPINRAIDPGPNVLLSDATEAEILKQLSWGLDRFSGYVGLNNHMGSRFTADSAGMRIVLRELKRRGLIFLDSRTSTKSVGGALARDMKVPHAVRNVFLDHDPSVETVQKQIKELERIARKQGYAVAIGHPRDATIQVLSQWLPMSAEKGYTLVPISAIVARRQGIQLTKKTD